MAGKVEQEIQSFANDGLTVGVITVMFPSSTFEPRDWLDDHGIQSGYITEVDVPTPDSLTVPPSNGSSIGTPYLTVVDPVTMEVVFQGNNGSNWPAIVRQTAEANANP